MNFRLAKIVMWPKFEKKKPNKQTNKQTNFPKICLKVGEHKYIYIF